MRKFFLLLALLVLCRDVAAATYYVKTGGSDGADGLSDGNAWASIGKLQTVSIGCNDEILFKCGDTWTQTGSTELAATCGTDGQYAKIGQYGTCTGSNKPIFTSIAEINGWTVPSNWTAHSTIPNAWYMTLATGPGRLWLNDVEYKAGTETGTYGISTEWVWAVGTIDGVSGRLLVRTVSGAKPSTEYSSMKGVTPYGTIQPENPLRARGKNRVWITGIEFKGGGLLGPLQIVGGTGWKLNDLKFTMAKKGVSISGDATYGASTNGVAYDLYIDSGYQGITRGYDDMGGINDGIQLRNGVTGWEIYDVQTFCMAHEGIGLQADNVAVTAGVKNNYIHDVTNDFTNCFSGRGITLLGLAGLCQYNTFERILNINERDSAKVAGEFNRYSNSISYGHKKSPDYLVPNGSDTGGYAWRFDKVETGYVSTDNVVENVTVVGSESPCLNTHEKSGGSTSVKVERNVARNNAFIDCGTSPVTATNTNVCIEVESGSHVGANTYQNNQCYNSSGTTLVRYQGSNITVTAFNALNGSTSPADVISGNFSSAPAFVDQSGHDYHLTVSSPGIDVGVPSTTVLDYDENVRPVGTDYDIGAFEYQVVSQKSGLTGASVRGIKICPGATC